MLMESCRCDMTASRNAAIACTPWSESLAATVVPWGVRLNRQVLVPETTEIGEHELSIGATIKSH